MMVLRTECQNEMFAGFFGINADGMQPECGTVITEEVDGLDGFEADREGVRPAYAVTCPGCGCQLEWPHDWEIVRWDEGPQNFRRVKR